MLPTSDDIIGVNSASAKGLHEQFGREPAVSSGSMCYTIK